MVQVDIAAISDEEKASPEFQQKLAAFQTQFNALEKNPRDKFRLCLHEAGHMVYFRRLGWTLKRLRGPYMYRNGEGERCNILGSVRPNREKTDDLLGTVKADIAGFVLVEAVTGEPESETTIKNDLRFFSNTAPDVLKEMLKLPAQMVINDFENDGFKRELFGAIREYENEIFGTDSTWLWGWRTFRLDQLGQRYAVGHDGLNWLLIDDGNQLRLVVDGAEVSPAKKYELFFVAGGASASERANDAVRRWNQAVSAAKVKM